MNFAELIALGVAELHRGAYEAAADAFERAREVADSEADHALAEMHLASMPVLQGKREADLSVFRENVMRRHSTRHTTIAAYYLTVAATDRGDREAATRYLPVLLDAARQLGDPVMLVSAFDAAAGAESIRGNHAAAIEYGRIALDSIPEEEDQQTSFQRAGLTHNLAYNCLAASRYAEALDYAVEAVRLSEPHPFFSQALVTAAFAYLCRDEHEDALRTLDRAEPLITGTPLEKYMHYVRGEVARRRGDRDEAARHFKRLEAFYPGIPTLTEMLLSMNLAPFLLPE